MALLIALLLALPPLTIAEVMDIVVSSDIESPVEEASSFDLGDDEIVSLGEIELEDLTIDLLEDAPEEIQREDLDELTVIDESAVEPFDQSVTLDGVTVTVTASAGVFPEDATLHIKKLKKEKRAAITEAVESAISEEGVYTHRPVPRECSGRGGQCHPAEL